MKSDPKAEILEHVVSTLSSLKGVKHAFILSDPVRAELVKIEKEHPLAGPVPVSNTGIKECLRRQHVACVAKDKSFRPPPQPTVVLVDEDGKLIGWELLPGEKVKQEPGKKVLYLGKDFVICYDGKGGKNSRFILPPIPFIEVETLGGVSNVCSSSPSSIGDLFLRRSASLDDDPKLASILIGFDLE